MSSDTKVNFYIQRLNKFIYKYIFTHIQLRMFVNYRFDIFGKDNFDVGAQISTNEILSVPTTRSSIISEVRTRLYVTK